MKFHMLVLEGDKKAEKDKPHLPSHTKNDYLHRKWIESRPTLRNRSFYLCRMIEEALKGVEIDGSRKIIWSPRYDWMAKTQSGVAYYFMPKDAR